MPNATTPEDYPVKSVGRALEILEAVAGAGEGGLSLTELAHEVKLAKSSTSSAARTSGTSSADRFFSVAMESSMARCR